MSSTTSKVLQLCESECDKSEFLRIFVLLGHSDQREEISLLLAKMDISPKQHVMQNLMEPIGTLISRRNFDKSEAVQVFKWKTRQLSKPDPLELVQEIMKVALFTTHKSYFNLSFDFFKDRLQ